MYEKNAHIISFKLMSRSIMHPNYLSNGSIFTLSNKMSHVRFSTTFGYFCKLLFGWFSRLEEPIKLNGGHFFLFLENENNNKFDHKRIWEN